MSEGAGFVGAARAMLEVAFAVVLPILALKLERRILDRVAPADYFEIPLVTGSARFFGLALGITLLYARFADRRYFDLNRLFTPQSPWNLSLVQFLRDRANPFDYGIGTLVDDLQRHGAQPAVLSLLAMVAVAAVAALAAPLRFWPLPAARRAVLASLVLAGFDAYLTIYLVCLVLWCLFLLNFWVFAVAGVVFQYYRGRARHSSG
ncbi:MAG TPA: hypothetical protein VGR91_04745 [Stellaceae bacterium]|nr:hypothetical protein [Stellaceae bacterium]